MVLTCSRKHLVLRRPAGPRRYVLVLMVLLVLASSGSCNLFEPMDPQQVVAEFCKQDLLGARLEKGRWSEIEDYIDWPIDEGSTRTVAISGYRVGTAKIAELSAEVPVVYFVRGVLEGEQWQSWAQGEGRHLVKSAPKEVDFRLESVDGDWVIVEPRLAPHVSLSLLSEHLPAEATGSP